jgi:hypothetical protein
LDVDGRPVDLRLRQLRRDVGLVVILAMSKNDGDVKDYFAEQTQCVRRRVACKISRRCARDIYNEFLVTRGKEQEYGARQNVNKVGDNEHTEN